MMQTKDFNTLVREQVANIQGGAKQLIDLSVGSVLRAISESYASVALWLQALILNLLATTRAATSNGSDLDGWMADYGLTRLAGTTATGQVTFARFTNTYQAVVPVGAVVQTGDGSQKYSVNLDTTNPNYNALLGGFVLASGVSSIQLNVTAVNVGIAGNAVLSGINTIAQAIPSVDTVTNGAAFTNGTDSESDAALRVRFVAYMASLSKGTKAAVGYAITSLQQGLSYVYTENLNLDGSTHFGYFYVVVDDGTGYPSSVLLSNVYNAIDAVRAVTVTFAVFPPLVVTANVSMTITTLNSASHSSIVAIVSTAIANYINGIGLGNGLTYTRLVQVAYDASPFVTNVSAVIINGATSDIAATGRNTIKAGTVAVA